VLLLDGREREITEATAVEVAVELADAITRRSPGELRDVLAMMRRAAADSDLDEGERATAAVQATAIAGYLDRAEDPLPAMLRLCAVVERANSDPRFDWVTAMFEVGDV